MAGAAGGAARRTVTSAPGAVGGVHLHGSELSQTLRGLVADGLVTRHVESTGPPQSTTA
ncbi:hypothetical protein AB0M34_34070 [Nocardia sp. NPDC050193]